MKLNLNTFILSHSLEKHPVLNEKVEYKLKYLSVLNYFVTKYSSTNNMAKAMLENYKSAFMFSKSTDISLEPYKIKSYIRKVTANKISFKGFKLFSYRYCVLCDVFFINAFDDQKTAVAIFSEIKQLLSRRYHSKLEQLYSILYENNENINGFGLAEYQINCWRQNKALATKLQRRILITANMSAGKSTLINTLIGKSVNKTMNTACTTKIHYIYDKAFEDNYIHELDYELNLNADHKALMTENEQNIEDKILVATHFRMLVDKKYRMSIIDTPGVNFSTNKKHGEYARTCIRDNNYDLLLYVVNAENAGTDDDFTYLTYISKNVPKTKIIFALNKLDHFRKSEDSVVESIKSMEKELVAIGFENPVICPISSYAGMLAKKRMWCEDMTEDESDEYEMLKKKFNRPGYDLSQFYPKARHGKAIQADDENSQLLIKSGIYDLEQIILQRSQSI